MFAFKDNPDPAIPWIRQILNPQKTLDNYVLADCRINKKTIVGGTALDVYFGVNNLFDEDYELSYGYQQAGQTFYGGVNWTF